jgi:hypothetical protein
MVATVARGRRERLALFADALLLAVGAFVALSALALAIQGVLQLFLGSRPLWLDAFGGLAVFVPSLAGALAAWTLHGHRITWLMLAGWALGLFVAGAVAALVVTIASQLFGAFEAAETFPIGLVVVAATVSAIALFLIGIVTLDALRDLRAEVPVKRRLDALRLVSAGLLGVLLIVVSVVMLLDPTSEVGEAIVFALMFGFVASFMALGADVVTGLGSRRIAHQ